MSFASLLDKTATVKRLTANGDTEAYTTTISTSVKCNIQPISTEMAALGEGSYWQSYKMYCLNTENIKAGDTVTVNGTLYTVKGIQEFTDGNFPHFEIMLNRGDE